MKGDTLEFQGRVCRKQVIGTDDGILQAMVDQKRQPATPVSRRTIPTDDSMLREISYRSRGRRHFGLLEGRHSDTVFLQVVGQLTATVPEAVTIELQKRRGRGVVQVRQVCLPRIRVLWWTRYRQRQVWDPHRVAVKEAMELGVIGVGRSTETRKIKGEERWRRGRWCDPKVWERSASQMAGGRGRIRQSDD